LPFAPSLLRLCPPGHLDGEPLQTSNIIGKDHLCVCFEAPEQRLAALVPHLALGLERGEKCIYLADRRALATHPLVVVNDAVYRNSYQVPPTEYLARGP
jgi:hypothetical protein